MNRYNGRMARAFSLLLIVMLAGCVSAGPPTEPNEREWQSLLTEYRNVQAARAAYPVARGEAPRRERLEVALNSLRQSEAASNGFLDRLNEYYERTGDPRAAQIYADEKVRVGDAYADLLARWDRAIELYRQALALDPTHEVARQRLARAEQRRYVTLDAFSHVRDGMTERQVEQLLGHPREDWIRQQVQGNRIFTVWIYPKNDGGAAAVYFEAGVVYHVNWNAAPTQGEEGGE